jgi:hypothetical protein
MTRDPTLTPQLGAVAKAQGQMTEDLNRFVDYVKDLEQWAKDTKKDRVGNDLGDVTGDIRRQDVGQKMVDAAVDLTQHNVGSAQATQAQIMDALNQTVGKLQETSDILAGSSTGVLARASREAKTIGQRVSELAGLTPPNGSGQPGQPGQQSPGQPGRNQPGQPGARQPGMPGQNQPGAATQPAGKAGEAPTSRPAGELAGAATQPGVPDRNADQTLAGMLANQDSPAESGGMPSPGQKGQSQSGGSGMGLNQDIEDVFMMSQRLVGTLKTEQLAEEELIKYMEKRIADLETFKKMFEKANKVEAGKFAMVATGIGQNLEAALQEALSAKRLNAEEREECPPQYRTFVNAYFEGLSKAVTEEKKRE